MTLDIFGWVAIRDSFWWFSPVPINEFAFLVLLLGKKTLKRNSGQKSFISERAEELLLDYGFRALKGQSQFWKQLSP